MDRDDDLLLLALVTRLRDRHGDEAVQDMLRRFPQAREALRRRAKGLSHGPS